MASVKKRRKHKKRRKIKTDSILLNPVRERTINSFVANDNCAPAILGPNYKNFKHNQITKSKGSAFVSPSCITSGCSIPYLKPPLTSKCYRPPLIDTTHIFDTEPTKKIRRRKCLGSCTVFVPPSCIALNQGCRSSKTFQPTYVKPILLEKVAEIIMPTTYRHSKKRWFTGASFVPAGCITNHNSVVKNFKLQQPKKSSYLSATEHKPSPAIIGPTGLLRRRNKKYGNNVVLVPDGCIIKPRPIVKASSYDWRKAFPKPIALQYVADIVGPTVKIRHRKIKPNSGFVPAGCIIVPKEVAPPDLKQAVEKRTEAEAAALAQQKSTADNESDTPLTLLVVLVIAAIFIYAFVFNN